jgi:hypothetical protein
MGVGPFAMAGKFLKGASGGRGERREGRAAGGGKPPGLTHHKKTIE